jgi:mannose-6-phosphate isomerase-like protein (cupin superfamily)
VPVEYNLSPPNLIHTRTDLLGRDREAGAEWSQVVVKDNRNLATMIQDVPGGESRVAREAMSDEWWLMLEGTATVHVEEDVVLDVETGDIVLVEAGTHYGLRTTGEAPSRRILVTAPN